MNEYKDLADSLNKDKAYIPRARRIFNNLSSIESILDTGVTFNSLATILNNNGFEIDFIQLKNSVYQARKKLKKQGGDIVESAPLNNALNHQKTITTTTTINQSAIDKTAVINQVESSPKENKPLTTKDIIAESERYNEQHEIDKAQKDLEQKNKKLRDLINKQNKDK